MSFLSLTAVPRHLLHTFQAHLVPDIGQPNAPLPHGLNTPFHRDTAPLSGRERVLVIPFSCYAPRFRVAFDFSPSGTNAPPWDLSVPHGTKGTVSTLSLSITLRGSLFLLPPSTFRLFGCWPNSPESSAQLRVASSVCITSAYRKWFPPCSFPLEAFFPSLTGPSQACGKRSRTFFVFPIGFTAGGILFLTSVSVRLEVS